MSDYVIDPVPEGITDQTAGCWTATDGTRHECVWQTEIETSVWVPKGDGSGYLTRVRSKTVREVYDEIMAVVAVTETYGDWPGQSLTTVPGAEEYFTICDGEGDKPWPSGRTVAYALTGGSEGHYVHVDVLGTDRETFVLVGKTFHGKDAAWTLARRLANLLGL